MHKWGKEILECVKTRVEAIGVENFEGQALDDLKDWTEIAKNIACFDKDYRIVEAMDKAEDEKEVMEMIEHYEDYPERRYYDNYRYKTSGKFAPKGKGTYVGRRGYDEPMYHMPLEMYRDYTPEELRDMDRYTRGVMYYTEPLKGEKMAEMPESRYDRAKRMYTESKDMHKTGTPEDKQAKMKSLEAYAKELTEDVMSVVEDMTPEERALLKNKVQLLAQKL